jgi:hypothetical protein
VVAAVEVTLQRIVLVVMAVAALVILIEELLELPTQVVEVEVLGKLVVLLAVVAVRVL